MSWRRTSTVGPVPYDPVGDAVAAAVVEIFGTTSVAVTYHPAGTAPPPWRDGGGAAVAHGPGPDGWDVQLVVGPGRRVVPPDADDTAAVDGLVAVVPAAALATARRLAPLAADGPLGPALRRALRDTLAAEVLARRVADTWPGPAPTDLIAEVLEFLVELSGSRVEAHDLTHGVLITDALPDEPRLRFDYPADLRAAKRSPLLFDGQRSVLVVDRQGRARTELQRHRLDRLAPGGGPPRGRTSVERGALVAEATSRLGGIGLYLRADRTIWSFLDGRPLLMRRAEHWTAFPLELASAIEQLIGGATAAALVVETAFTLSALGRGAILAIVDRAERLHGVVSEKDRYDLRDSFDPPAMRIETRLHHLIDAEPLDQQVLARLAALDGATIVDRDARLLAYGAIVASSDSQYEGARTAAAKTLSETAEVVLKVSTDGDITVFRAGRPVATLLGRTPGRRGVRRSGSRP